MIKSRVFFFWLGLLLFWWAPLEALAQRWVNLAPFNQAFFINGVETKTVFHPRLSTRENNGLLLATLDVRGVLSDFRRIAPTLTLWRKPIDIFNTALVLKGQDLRPDPPGVIAEGVLALAGTNEATVVKARLLPVIENNAIRLKAAPVGRMKEGLLKTALKVLGLKEANLNPLHFFLNRSLSDEESWLRFPPELERFNPVFKSVAFTDPGFGGLGLNMGAEFDLRPEDLPYLIDVLTHIGD